MADFTLTALAAELDADPQAIGYGASWRDGDGQLIADLINAKNFFIDKDHISAGMLFEQVTYDAYNNLAIDEQEFYGHMITVGADPNGEGIKITSDVKLQLTGRTLTSDGTAGTGNNNSSWWAAADRALMAPAYLALLEVSGSRAEVLWGEGRIITAGNVGAAANI